MAVAREYKHKSYFNIKKNFLYVCTQSIHTFTGYRSNIKMFRLSIVTMGCVVVLLLRRILYGLTHKKLIDSTLSWDILENMKGDFSVLF